MAAGQVDTVKAPIADLAIQRGESYSQTYTLALQGKLGRVIREGRRLFVVQEPEPPEAA